MITMLYAGVKICFVELPFPFFQAPLQFRNTQGTELYIYPRSSIYNCGEEERWKEGELNLCLVH